MSPGSTLCGGLGLKHFSNWNKTVIAKLVWAISNKQDTLWVKWVHERYIKQQDWWDYTPAYGSSWYWKKLCKIKELFKQGCAIPRAWDWQGQNTYQISKGHQWLMPSHTTHQLPTKHRLNKLYPQPDTHCAFCHLMEEVEMHLFFKCNYARAIWQDPDLTGITTALLKLRVSKASKSITYAIFTSVIYYIWSTRNQVIFRHQIQPHQRTFQTIKEQVIHRILYINSLTHKYDMYIDRLVQ
ncbi:hypothetical protein Cgig2_034125 [Carnegiea gigantea]|uniref:Reverse transcriptase zinc-binding domain-containing protein n=1 Tax=Carnegiea gigantea TaxID=171969 RepID=A0A9Q1KCZ6_9CARY|nr:hypothetical protein Cgig2_034125 [Carnegiea gigantea]